MTDRSKSIAQLEGNDWGDPGDASPLFRRVFALRNKPIRDFDAEDARVMIGQDVGLAQLIPVALEFLTKNPYCAGMHYPGDLLINVLRADPAFFRQHRSMRCQLEEIIDRAKTNLDQLSEADKACLIDALADALKTFAQSE
ncbi:hypothetical protein SAMN02745857_01065 [Andreprevotia lacus DSM 23236]|jgi:hypothetical protein|uniref:Uncharacterized protein n=1 Tax=Andreprevotia lacus DSM 23236 TaxID=1121001 RepID=A0A1W1XAK0_9NEIS|nr:contact-dependent growth inhibition system immunity protein [Andreprevotia lacus]SMC20877.1 hypothetical protein SAMN02745857_01065 [Andreprevotia lacus DSM 23236]